MRGEVRGHSRVAAGKHKRPSPSSSYFLAMTSLSSAPTASNWLYFLAGALLPTIAYALGKNGRNKRQNDDSDDEDLDGVEESGPSSQWGLMHGPYKVRGVLGCGS